MKARERDRLLRLIADPPKGSKIALAKEFGVDLTLNVRKLGLTPTERLEEMQSFQLLLEELRHAVQEQAE
ncbi:MAG: hypothetical protein ACRD3A_11875 [Terriglobales bacterium]